MSAEILRQAAALMRERAEAATPGPWTTPEQGDGYVGPHDVVTDGTPGERFIVCEHAGPDDTYIASWHPVVALAVAKALDDVAMAWLICDGSATDLDGDSFPFEETVDGGWLQVARAYLGEKS